MIVSTVADKLTAAGIEVTSQSKDHPAGGSIILTQGILIRVCTYHMEVVNANNKVIAVNILTLDDLLKVIQQELVKYNI